jgi:uncharacterized protein YcbX
VPDIRLTSIHVYPMKAARAVDLGESKVEPWGLADDRRWMLADQDGRFISQREEPALARVSVLYAPNEAAVTISAPRLPRCRVAVPAGTKLLKVSVWGSSFGASMAGPAADAWFSAYLGRPVRLVYLDDPARRPVTRFRPNVVITGAPPWAEDRWRRIRIGAVPFRVVKPCGRCVVTTTDQVTGERGRQPLRMLGQRRRFGKVLVFGQNMIPDAGGLIRVGDPVEIVEAALPAEQ